jgi:hypothetical protein
MNKKIILSVLLVAVLASLGGLGWIYKDQIMDLFDNKNVAMISDEESLFSLQSDNVLAGNITDAESSFTFQSKIDLSEDEVHKLVKFSPEVEYEVEKRGGVLSSLIPEAKAQDSEDEGEMVYNYTITPLAELVKGELLVAQIEGDNELTNRDYSWAFAVEADFQVIKSLPRHQATYVPTDSVIEIEFNERIDESVTKYVSVTPELEYQAEIVDSRLVLKHGGLTESTVYEVLIDSQLFAEKESSYEGDFKLSFETDSVRADRNTVSFWSDYETFFPEGDKFFEIGYSEFTSETFNEAYTTNLYAYETADDFMSEYRDSKNWDWYWTSLYKNRFDDDVTLEKAQKLYEVEPELVERNYRSVLYIPNELEEGVYALEIVGEGGDKSVVWFQVSPIAYYYTYTSESGLIWLYDFESDTYVNDAEISLISSSGEERLGETDDKGSLTYETPQYLKDRNDGEGDGLPSSFKIEWNGNTYLSLVEDSYWFGFYYPQADKYWNYLSTDRYVYRPTDKINFWGVVKGREDDLQNDRVEVELTGGGFYYYDYFGGNTLASTKAVISSFDTVKGELDISGIEPGYYTLTVSKDDEIVTSSSLQVIDFTTPAYQIVATPDVDSVFAGEEVRIEVEANFFDGTPVSNLEVTYNDYIGEYGNISDRSLQLDENGKGELVITAAYSQNEYSYGPNSRSIYFRSGNAEQGEVSAQTEVTVLDHDIYVQTIAELDDSNDDKMVTTVKVNKLEISETEKDDQGYFRNEYIAGPLAGKSVEAEVIGRYYQKYEDGFYYDPIAKTSTPQYRYELVEDSLRVLTGVTDADGEIELIFEPTEEQKELYDSYFMELKTVDDRGRTLRKQHYMTSRGYRGFGERNVSLTLKTEGEEPEVEIGEEFMLELDVPEVSQLKINEYLYFGYKTAIHEVDITAELELEKEFQEQYVPGVAYQAVVLSEEGFEETNRVVASYDESRSALNVNLSTDKDSYRPRETVEVDVEVTDVDGDPVEAEVNLASVDEALFHILPFDFTRDILTTLYIDNIDSPKSGANRNESLEAASLDAGAEQGGCFLAGTQILMADGSYRNIEDVKVGDQVLSFTDEKAETKKIVTVQGVHNYEVGGYMIVNETLEVTGEHEVFLNGKWQHMGSAEVGDYMVGVDGEPVEIESIQYVRKDNTKVFNLNVSDTHTYIADNYYVHNAEKGGAERSEFRDVTLYESIRTNAGGEASVEFELPDNLTSWRISAKAFENEKILAGQNDIKVPVSLPLFVNASVSKQYLVGDKPMVTLRAYGNDLNRDEPVNYRVEIEGLMESEASSPTGRQNFELGELAAGEYEIKMTVAQGDLSDTLVQKFEVVESYEQKQDQLGMVLSEEGAIDMTDDALGLIEVELSPEGKGIYLPKLRQANYVVNGRLDHLVGQNLAVDILRKEYGIEDTEKTQFSLSDYSAGAESGLALFQYDEEDLELTALVADAMSDEIIKSRTVSYLRNQLDNNKTDIERVAVALYGLASLGENVYGETLSLADSEDNTLKSDLFLGLALEQMRAKESARSVYVNRIRDMLDGDFDRNLQPLVALLAARTGFELDAQALVEDIALWNEDGEVYGLASVLAMQEFIPGIELTESRVTLKYGNQEEEYDLSDGYTRSFKVSSNQADSMTVDSIEGQVHLLQRYVAEGRVAANSNNLSVVDRRYLVNGVETTSFEEGDIVRVEIDVDDSSYDQAVYKNYVITDYLPSGLKPIINDSDLNNFNNDRRCAGGFGVKAVGNVVSVSRGSWMFNGANNCQNSEVVYFARVVATGEYKAQAAQIEEISNPGNVARGEDELITIQ